MKFKIDIKIDENGIIRLEEIEGGDEAIKTTKRLMKVFDPYKDWEIVIMYTDTGKDFIRVKNSFVDGFSVKGSTGRWLLE